MSDCPRCYEGFLKPTPEGRECSNCGFNIENGSLLGDAFDRLLEEAHNINPAYLHTELEKARQQIITLRTNLEARESQYQAFKLMSEQLKEELARVKGELDEACDRHYRNGFNAGWNAGVDGNEQLLKSVNENRTKHKGE